MINNIIWPEQGTDADVVLRAAALLRKNELNAELKEIKDYDLSTDNLDKLIMKKYHKVSAKAPKKERRISPRNLAAVAVLLILMLLSAPTVIFAFSPDFREAVIDFVIQRNEGNAEISTIGDVPKLADDNYIAKYYVPNYLPQGFVATNIIDEQSIFDITFENGDDFIYYTQSSLNVGFSLDTDRTNLTFEDQILGYQAVFAINENDEISVLWNNGENLFLLQTNLDLDEAKKIANSLIYQKKYP